MRDRFDRFCRAQAGWLDDFALFMAVKDAHGQAAWTTWEPDIAQRDPSAVAQWSARCAREIRLHKLTQFLFFEQWQRVRDACRARSIQIMGDLPIFVAHDSADVWARRELFRLDADGQPTVLAGVPPDYFSATGQLWGNPHYRWDVLAQTGYALVDRALSRPAGAGRSRPHRSLPRIRGVVGSAGGRDDGHTRRVGERAGRVALRGRAIGAAARIGCPSSPRTSASSRRKSKRCASGWAFPGWRSSSLRSATTRRRPISSRTTTRETSSSTPAHTTTTPPWDGGPAQPATARDRTPRSSSEREHARRYLGLDGRDVHWEFIRAVLASVADTAIVPAQDLLGLGQRGAHESARHRQRQLAVAAGSRAADSRDARESSP